MYQNAREDSSRTHSIQNTGMVKHATMNDERTILVAPPCHDTTVQGPYDDSFGNSIQNTVTSREVLVPRDDDEEQVNIQFGQMKMSPIQFNSNNTPREQKQLTTPNASDKYLDCWESLVMNDILGGDSDLTDGEISLDFLFDIPDHDTPMMDEEGAAPATPSRTKNSLTSQAHDVDNLYELNQDNGTVKLHQSSNSVPVLVDNGMNDASQKAMTIQATMMRNRDPHENDSRSCIKKNAGMTIQVNTETTVAQSYHDTMMQSSDVGYSRQYQLGHLQHHQPLSNCLARVQDPHKLRDNDILLGRGSGPNLHPGNKRFRKLIQKNKSGYRKLPKGGKAKKNYTLKLFKQITDYGGRFMVQSGKILQQVNKEEARKKISQRLRD